MGELHQKYQQRLTETTNLQTAEHFNLRSSLQSATAEYNGGFLGLDYFDKTVATVDMCVIISFG